MLGSLAFNTASLENIAYKQDDAVIHFFHLPDGLHWGAEENR